MRNTIKKPVIKGAVKVPIIMQMEALECGAASLAMVMAYYGKWVPLEQVRDQLTGQLAKEAESAHWQNLRQQWLEEAEITIYEELLSY